MHATLYSYNSGDSTLVLCIREVIDAEGEGELGEYDMIGVPPYLGTLCTLVSIPCLYDQADII